uniref:3-deoxy-7-phosphoheptulonate synthase n=1 Tax=Hyaloperonospora arabidopsidis (strain Emoy2) TaxID=559515 RepID=M4BZN1_HYAAE|nr:RxLR effector candidate protein [Hyaloperonospora arabidopsidis Emoy2]
MSHSTSLTLGLGLLAATMTIVTAGSVGLLGFILGRQLPQQETPNSSSLHDKSSVEQERRRQLRIPSGTASEDVKISDRNAIVDVRISGIRPLMPPAILQEEIPLTTTIVQTSWWGRALSTTRTLPWTTVSSRILVEAKRLLGLKKELNKELLIVMRVYFEKPRTTVGWKGLINDPDLDGSFNINKGLRVARELLAAINELGLPAGCEFLDTMSPQFISDLVSWGAIGARTTECQLHRELCSGLSMPIGFKNGTGGDLQLAVDAVVAAKHPHCFLSVSSQGLAAIVNTSGNDTCHLILRGGKVGPNFEKEHVVDASARMLKADLVDNIMVDCSHGNSQKKHKNQVTVAANIADQLRAGDDRIVGVMLESNIEEGNQPLAPGKPLVYGKSVTDACMGWETTVEVLRDLASAVRERRATKHQ